MKLSYRIIAVYPPAPAPGRVTLLKMDIDTLEDGEELNDAIIDFFIKYINLGTHENHAALKNCFTV